jgi:hypothetical protein
MAPEPGRLTPRERAPCTHWIGGWAGPRAGLNDAEERKFFILPGLDLRTLSRPAVASQYTDFGTSAPGAKGIFSISAQVKQYFVPETYSSSSRMGLFVKSVCR